MTSDLQDNPFVMSTMREYEDDPNGQRSYYYRVIIWLKTVRPAHDWCANAAASTKPASRCDGGIRRIVIAVAAPPRARTSTC